MTPAIAFARTPISPPPYPFQLGTLLLNGVITELNTAPRRYHVRPSIDSDHPMIAADREDARRRGYTKWVTCITVVRLADDKRWIFAERTASFPRGFEHTDSHAVARLAANERAKARLFGDAQ